MKIALAQIQSTPGKLEENIQQHLRYVEKAATLGAQLVIFPELSLTNYEPQLAAALATEGNDSIFAPFQILSQQLNITIGVGMPIRAEAGVQIGLLIFTRRAPPRIYAKRYLHEDELPYFIPGEEKVMLPIGEERIAPAICFESLLMEHIEEVAEEGATVYLASVAKSEKGIQKSYAHYAKISKEFKMPVLMVNGLGPMDNFVGAGQSAAWDREGKKLGVLPKAKESILVVDLESMSSVKYKF